MCRRTFKTGSIAASVVRNEALAGLLQRPVCECNVRQEALWEVQQQVQEREFMHLWDVQLCLKLTSSRPHVTWAKRQQNLSQLSLMEFTNIYLFFQFSIPVRVMCSAA